MSLLLLSTLAAMFAAKHGPPPFAVVLWTLLGGALMSGGAGAINHYVDRDIDALMGRTAWRPIPSGMIPPRRALAFGIALAVVAFFVLASQVNLLAAYLSSAGLIGYVFVYTLWLKRRTPMNIVIGGASGAVPPLVGWAAITGDLSLPANLGAWCMFALVFLWTPPHFWSLALLIKKHYSRAGVPMLPVVRGEPETRMQILAYALLLTGAGLVVGILLGMGVLYLAASVALGIAFVVLAANLCWRPGHAAARATYLYSLLYLALLFTAMAADRVQG
jgi:protoheme IX farnesyltransferase